MSLYENDASTNALPIKIGTIADEYCTKLFLILVRRVLHVVNNTTFDVYFCSFVFLRVEALSNVRQIQYMYICHVCNVCTCTCMYTVHTYMYVYQ